MPKTHKWSDLKRKKLSPAALKKVEQEVEQELLEMDLRYLREMTNMTQSELAELLEMTQSEVSRLENRSDHRLSTLRRIVEAMGGELEVFANFGDKKVRLRSAC